MDIKGYKIHRKIGEGAMASVFLATQASLGRQVALKVMAPGLAKQRGFTPRFLKEGRIIAYLRHPQIVNVYDLGSYQHNYYLAMEYLPGGTLEDKIRSGLSPARSVQVIKQISQALNYAHINGVIHRDIKSQNIMFREDDIPVLTDFGIARLMDDDPQLTIPGRIVGSPLYMSPEQVCGRKIDARTDLYSVGILFFEMLTSRLPYQSDNFMAIALMHKTAPIPVLPDELSVFQPVLNRLLDKDPGQRYSSANDLIKDFERIESENPGLTRTLNSDHYHSRPSVHLSAARMMNFSVDSKDNLTGDATQPAFDPLSEADAPMGSSSAEGEGDGVQKMNDDIPPRSTGAAVRRAGLITAGVMLVLAVGIFTAGNYSLEIFAVLPKSSSPPLIGTNTSIVVPTALDTGPTQTKQTENRDLSLQENHHAQADATSQVDRPALDQKIDDLMAKAQRQLATYSLTSPAGDNCYETYQQLLALDPSGRTAETLLKKIGETYGKLALTAEAKGELRKGMTFVGKGLALLLEDSVLLALKEDLRVKLVEQTRILQEQARQVERQQRKRAAEMAAIEKIRKIEREQEARRRKEAEGERLERQREELEILEREKAKVKIEQPEPTEVEAVSRKRLFGTF